MGFLNVHRLSSRLLSIHRDKGLSPPWSCNNSFIICIRCKGLELKFATEVYGKLTTNLSEIQTRFLAWGPVHTANGNGWRYTWKKLTQGINNSSKNK